MCVANSDVRFTPHSDRESGFPQTVMSALPPIADMCSALAADIGASHIKDESDYFMAGMLPLAGIFICISAGIVVLSSFWKVGRSSGDVITSAP